MSARIIVHRIGSDPELVLSTHPPGEAPKLLGMNMLLTPSREENLTTWIGGDGHPTTGEIRPAPCHNVKWHLAKIADALGQLKERVDYLGNRGGTQITPLAQPAFEDETMGGHVHVSFWYAGELTSYALHTAGVIALDPEHPARLDSGQYRPSNKSRTTSLTTKYLDGVKQETELSLGVAWRKLHWLLGPFERGFWGTMRAKRDAINDAHVRVRNGNNPNIDLVYRPGWGYFHFEYRYPSTWLSHPDLAYCNLGLAKLALLNWNLLPKWEDLASATVAPTRKMAATMALSRLDKVWSNPGRKLSRDLAGLQDVVKRVLSEARPVPPVAINFKAWREFAAEGETS